MENLKDTMIDYFETIELILPFKAEYVSTARLTASSVASKMGFNIEEVEDIKVALSEVCSKLVSRGSKVVDSYRIVFKLFKDKLTIVFCCEDGTLNCVFDNENDSLGIAIMNALMDDVELCTKTEQLLLISKVLKGEKQDAI
ncbi:MAG: ATP-binding protein [Clostridia bacterium]